MRPRTACLPAVVTTIALVTAGSTSSSTTSPVNLGDSDAARPRTIVELQTGRQAQSIGIKSRTQRAGTATLVNLNPAHGAWYVLEVRWNDGVQARAYHLENPRPSDRTLLLDETYPAGLVIATGALHRRCDLFSVGPPDLLEQGRASQRIFQPLCESQVYLRNPAVGHRTGLEAATEFLRDRVWGGESVIGLGHQLLSDLNRQTGTLRTDTQAAGLARAGTEGPQDALIDPQFNDRIVVAPSLGIRVPGLAHGGLAPGVWYPTGTEGSYVSIIQPSVIAPGPLRGDRAANPLDNSEGAALCYLMAFDLERFRVGYARGTVHPEVRWSEHMLARMKNDQLAGPDGIGSIAPLVATGLVPPDEVRRTVATFTAGFKRSHGAFLYGDLSLVNSGSHYGFIENGVVFSQLQPGLATVVVRDDGSVDMKTWEQKDDQQLPRIRHARQNGVAVVEMSAGSQTPVPGRLVTAWGAGNWSGSQDRKLRTMRSGLALQNAGGRRYLIYAVFSSATPSAMARVFQAYRCQYAMLLDMNALEHTYLAFYRPLGAGFRVEYLMKGMQEVDENVASSQRPAVRFIGYPDNRDFFFVTRLDEERKRP